MSIYRPWTSPTLGHATLVRHVVMWVDVISAAAMVLRPLVVSLSIITAAATWSPPGHADPADDSITNALNEAGIGNNGSVSTAIAEIGQKICPMLVRPGATLASAASEVAGHTGLSPAIAGFVTSMAIQMECPGVMTSLADGNVPFPLQLPSADSAPPGANPVPPMPFALPGPSPTPTNAAQLPVL